MLSLEIPLLSTLKNKVPMVQVLAFTFVMNEAKPIANGATDISQPPKGVHNILREMDSAIQGRILAEFLEGVDTLLQRQTQTVDRYKNCKELHSESGIQKLSPCFGILMGGMEKSSSEEERYDPYSTDMYNNQKINYGDYLTQQEMQQYTPQQQQLLLTQRLKQQNQQQQLWAQQLSQQGYFDNQGQGQEFYNQGPYYNQQTQQQYPLSTSITTVQPDQEQLLQYLQSKYPYDILYPTNSAYFQGQGDTGLTQGQKFNQQQPMTYSDYVYKRQYRRNDELGIYRQSKVPYIV